MSNNGSTIVRLAAAEALTVDVIHDAAALPNNVVGAAAPLPTTFLYAYRIGP